MGRGYPSSSSTPLPEWTHRQNKDFEDALAIFGPETPDRWEKIASRVSGKTAADVKWHYESLVEDVNSIDSGVVPLPLYVRDWDDDLPEELATEFQLFQHPSGGSGKRFVGRGIEQERKKGMAWTEEEHRLFLMGLKKYGKGDWRSISRNFVLTRTPTQVASHAQKFFIRLNSGGTKDKRRPSIHDITSIDKMESALCSQDTTGCFAHSSSMISDLKATTPPTIITSHTSFDSLCD